MDQIELRPPRAGDLNFILSTMLRGLYYASGSFYGLMDKEEFFSHYDEVLQKLLKAAPTRVLIACLASEPDVILGYGLFGYPSTLHYLYVKPAWRKQGIANSLVKACGAPITHCTHVLNQFEDIRIKRGYKFNPFLKGV